MEPTDTQYTGIVICPWCGTDQENSEEFEESEYECDTCGNAFNVERHVEVSYSTYKAQAGPEEE